MSAADAMAQAVEHLRAARIAIVAARDALDNDETRRAEPYNARKLQLAHHSVSEILWRLDSVMAEVGGMGDRLRAQNICLQCRGAKMVTCGDGPIAIVHCPRCRGTGWEG